MFRNDPDLGAIPMIGEGTLDIARRTSCGQAARFGGDLKALVEFIGDGALVAIEDRLYRRLADETMVPLGQFKLNDIIVVPPAGDWFTIREHELRTDFASVVHVEPRVYTGNTTSSAGQITRTLTLVNPPKAAVKKAAPKKAAAKKAAPKPK